MRLNRRISKLEHKGRPAKELPSFFVCLGNNPQGEPEADISEAAREALEERAAYGYDRDSHMEDGRAWDLRRGLTSAPDPGAYVRGLSEEEFAGMMTAIGFFAGLRPPGQHLKYYGGFDVREV